MAIATETVEVLPDTSKFGAMLTGELGKSATSAAQSLSRALLPVSAALGAVGLKASGTFRDIGGDIRTLGRETGLAIEPASRLRFEAQQTGVEMNVLAIASRQLSKNLINNESDFAALGIATRDARGQLLGFEDVLGGVADVFAGLPDGPQKTALALQLFGRQGAALIPLLNQGKAGLRSLGDEAKRLGLVLDESGVRTLKEATKASRDLTAAQQGLEFQVGKTVLPFQTGVKSVLVDLASLAASTPVVAQAIGTVGIIGQALTLVSAPLATVASGMEIAQAVTGALRARRAALASTNAQLAVSELAVGRATRATNLAQQDGFLPKGAGGMLGGPKGSFLTLGPGGALGAAGSLAAAGAAGVALGEAAALGIKKGLLSFAGADSDETIARTDAFGDAQDSLREKIIALRETTEGKSIFARYKSEITDGNLTTAQTIELNKKLQTELQGIGDRFHNAATGVREYSLEFRKIIQQSINADFSKVDPFGESKDQDAKSVATLRKNLRVKAALVREEALDSQRFIDQLKTVLPGDENAAQRAQISTAIGEQGRGTLKNLVKGATPQVLAEIVTTYKQLQNDSAVISTVRTTGESLGSVEGSAAGQAAIKAIQQAFAGAGNLPIGFTFTYRGGPLPTTNQPVTQAGGTLSYNPDVRDRAEGNRGNVYLDGQQVGKVVDKNGGRDLHNQDRAG